MIGIVFSLFAAIFIVEFAPPRLTGVLEPVVRLLAAVPSVVYGLIGILVIVPWVGEHLISLGRKESVGNVIQLDGAGIERRNLDPDDHDRADHDRDRGRRAAHGSTRLDRRRSALGVNRWRVIWSIAVRTARPAMIAAAVLATARALGEAIMLSMVSGSASFAPNPIDGVTFFFEPTRPLASALVENVEGLTVVPFGQTLFAFAAVLLVSSMFLSLAGSSPASRCASTGCGRERDRHGAALPVRPPPLPATASRAWPFRDRVGYFARLGRRAWR